MRQEVELELNKNTFKVVNDEGKTVDGSGNHKFVVTF